MDHARKVRTTTSTPSAVTFSRVGSSVTVRMMSAAMSRSSPSRKPRLMGYLIASITSAETPVAATARTPATNPATTTAAMTKIAMISIALGNVLGKHPSRRS